MVVRRALVGLALISLTIVSSRAAAPLPPDSDFLSAVWVAQSQGVLKLSASDGHALCELPERAGAGAIAVDERGGALWVYTNGHLKSYSFGCALLSDTRSDLHRETVYLAINQSDGSAWLGADHRLFHFNATGKLKKELKLRDDLRGIAVDHPSPALDRRRTHAFQN